MASEKSTSIHESDAVSSLLSPNIQLHLPTEAFLSQKHVEGIQHGGKDHGLNVAAIVEDHDIEAISPDEREDKETRRIVRKIDMRLLPVLATIYSFALIDRVNLPNARIAGMDEDLGLSIGNRYTLVTMIFFVPYVIFQFPANIVIRKLGACLW